MTKLATFSCKLDVFSKRNEILEAQSFYTFYHSHLVFECALCPSGPQ